MNAVQREEIEFRESAFLACLLHCQDDALLRDCLTLPAVTFTDPARRTFYNAILLASEAGEELNEISVGVRLAQLDPIYQGGEAFRAVTNIYNQVDTSTLLPMHLERLRERAKLRQLQEIQTVASEQLAAGDLEAWRANLGKMTDVADKVGGQDNFTIRGLQEILDYKIPPDHGLIRNENDEALFEFGSVAGIVGPPGVGKSRMALQLAISQITGRTWCEMKTIGPARKWLLIGNENSRRRIARDMQGMCKSLAPEKVALLKANLYTQVPETDGDMVIALKADNMTRWRNTLMRIKPDVVVVDPFEACLENYDVNDAAGVRDTIQKMACLAHEANPDSTVIFVHHARTGQMNVSQATGYGKDNFAKGSKTFTSMIRLQINIAPGDPDDFGKLVISVGKSNDAKPFYPQGVQLDEATRLYEKWDGFDYDEWKAAVSKPEGGGKSRAGRKDKANLVREIVANGTNRRSEIVKRLVESHGISDKTARRYMTIAVMEKTIRECGLPGQFTTIE